MLFYVSAGILTLIMLVVAAWPLFRLRSPAAENEHLYDLSIYKDQLRELEADAARGAIDTAQAEYARTEIGRRILATQDAVEVTSADRGKASRPILAAVLVLVPVAAAVLYSVFGSPGMRDEPLALRLEEQRRLASQQTLQGMDVNELVSRAETQLARNPEDGRGWDVLAPMYLRLGRPDDARNAFERAIRLLGDSAARRSGLGQAHYMLAGGVVNGQARAEFSEALKLDSNDARARFFLALGAAQSGDVAAAIEKWNAMTADNVTPPEWKAAAAEGLRRFDTDAVAALPESSAPALDEETMRDAQAMDAEDRNAMIASMVERLDARLRENPQDLAGWQRLIRSYAVLGRADDAEDAVGRAIEAFAEDEEKRNQILGFAAALGLAAGEAVQ